MVCSFGQQVFDTLKGKGEKMLRSLALALKSLAGSFGYDPFTGNPTFQIEIGRLAQPEYTLKEIFDWLEQADKPCIVAFDEFQQISYYPEKNIEALLRGYIQHLSNVNFIYAGSERHILSEMFLSSARPFYNSTEQLALEPIVPEEYVPFVCHWFNAFDKQITQEDACAFYQMLEGNTFCMQKLFHEAFINTPVGQVCDRELLNKTLSDILSEEGKAYSKMLSRVPERQKELLYAIVREGYAQRILGGEFIRKHALASASAVQAASKKLLESGLITLENNVYSVQDIFLRLYLKRFV